MPGTELESRMNVAYAEYDFEKDGGAIGTINLRGDVIPDEALIEDGKIDVITAVTSGDAATVALGVNTTNDIKAATAIAGFSADAVLDVIPVRTAATCVRTTANRAVQMTIAAYALTAGKFRVALKYYMPRG